MATACLIAFFFVDGWLVPIDPSFFQSSTSVLILLLTIDRLDPFLSGMVVPCRVDYLATGVLPTPLAGIAVKGASIGSLGRT